MNASGIKDENTLEAWLKTRPQSDSITIATRAAAAAAARAAAAAATNAARAAAAAAATNAARAAAAAATNAAVWASVLADCEWLEADKPLEGVPLWHGRQHAFAEEWETTQTLWSTPNSPYAFWLRWYGAALEGRFLNPEVEHDIALIPDADWEEGATHIAGLIAGLERKHGYKVKQPTRISAEKLMLSALGQYHFDEIQRLMRMVPFAEDIEFLKDPEILEGFLKSAAEWNRKSEVLARAFAAEGRAMQGAGAIAVYLNEVSEELSRARQFGELRVGWLVDCGVILQGFVVDAQTSAEIGAMRVPFKASVDGLLDLTRRYFAQTLVRFAPLKDILSNDETSLHDLMEDIRRALISVSRTPPEDRIPLAPRDLAVFDSLLAEVERTIRAEFLSTDMAVKTSLRREVDFRLAQITVSLMLYLEQAPNTLKRAERMVQIVGSIEKGAGSLERIIDALKRGLG